MIYRNIQALFRLKVKLSSFTTKYLSTSEITAGVIIIGDEILSGRTQDRNSEFFIKNLNLLNLKLNKIAVLPDNVDIIAKEVSLLSDYCSVVLTSGGIGPTHDDVTYEAVSKAFGDQLVRNEELSLVYENYFQPKADENPIIVKFSSIPSSAKLNYGFNENGVKMKFPIVSLKNVYMLPGVPMLLPRSFEVFKANFLLYNKPKYIEHIFLTPDEFSITPVLNSAVKLFKGQIKFGSYPSFNENYYKVKLVLESKNQGHVEKGLEFLRNHLPDGSIVRLKTDLLSAKEDILKLCELYPKFKNAVSIVNEALSRYSMSEICICFNGGKDCTALLHLIYCCVMNSDYKEEWPQIQTFYVKNGETFEEVDKFIHSFVQRYSLNIITKTGDLKETFTEFINVHPNLKAVFVGVRRGDPGTENLDHFSQTSEDWPPVIRISPILDWTYSDVWMFIRSLQVPYCTLYDHGYTSLGTKSETVQNPALLRKRGFRSYYPAYLLKDNSDERNGRVK